MDIETNNTKCSVISLIGKPNTGKSTLINALVKYKISIVTPKVQTTRNVIRGIITNNNTQLIFLDTPGIFTPKRNLDKFMIKASWSSLVGADTALFLIDQDETFDDATLKIINYIKSHKTPIMVMINKIDLMSEEKIMLLHEKIKELLPSSPIFHISALKQTNLDNLYDHLVLTAPTVSWLYPADQVTTAPLRFLAAEITREKLFMNLEQELPYNLTVETESWKEQDNGDVLINQVITVSRDGHKMIVLGKGGAKIKKISMQAREEISSALEIKAHLYLFVKVRDAWLEKPERYLVPLQ
jgi:GTP-binding protein Era